MSGKVASFGLSAIAVLGILAGILYCEPLIKRLSNSAVLASRHGRIIDSASGEGLPDVIVIRKWLTGERCQVEKAAVTDSSGWYELPDAEADVTFHRTWLYDLTLKVLQVPLQQSGKFQAVIFLYKAGYVADLRPENALPDDPRAEVPPVRMRLESPASESLKRYDRALQNNLGCTFHGATAQPVARHLHIAGRPITGADKDPEPVFLCEGQPVASPFDCTYKDHPDLVKRAAKELMATTDAKGSE